MHATRQRKKAKKESKERKQIKKESKGGGKETNRFRGGAHEAGQAAGARVARVLDAGAVARHPKGPDPPEKNNIYIQSIITMIRTRHRILRHARKAWRNEVKAGRPFWYAMLHGHIRTRASRTHARTQLAPGGLETQNARPPHAEALHP